MARDGANDIVTEWRGKLSDIKIESSTESTATYTVKELLPLVTCAICKDIMVDAHYLLNCDDVFCRECIKRKLIGHNCPKCGAYCGDAVAGMV